jgi:hypothetical protein
MGQVLAFTFSKSGITVNEYLKVGEVTTNTDKGHVIPVANPSGSPSFQGTIIGLSMNCENSSSPDNYAEIRLGTTSPVATGHFADGGRAFHSLDVSISGGWEESVSCFITDVVGMSPDPVEDPIVTVYYEMITPAW